MPFFERRRDRVERERLELYARELERLYESAVEEKRRLERLLRDAREKALRLVEEYAPLSYRGDMGLVEALGVLEWRLEELERENARLLAELERLREEVNIARKAPETRKQAGEGEPVRVGEGLASLLKVGREQALRRWERLGELEKDVFRRIVLGCCTEGLLREAGGKRFLAAKSRLIEAGLVRALGVVRFTGGVRRFEVYFPSPLGVKVCEVTDLGGGVRPWTYLQYEYAREKGFTVDHDALVRVTVEKLRHANLEVSLDEFDLLVPGTSHRADIFVRERGLYVECETLSNTLEQTFKMLDAYVRSGREFYIVVASAEARWMVLQRLCFYAWECRRNLSFFLSSVRDLPNMSSLSIYREPAYSGAEQ